jgi:hypothetical protein
MSSPNLAAGQRRLELAVAARARSNLLGLLAVVIGSLVLNADLLDAAGTAGDGGSITVVGVDANERLAAASLDAADLNGTLELLLAISARAVQLAEVLNGEVFDDDGTAAVVLDDLVIGTLSTTTNDLVGAGAGTLEGEGI